MADPLTADHEAFLKSLRLTDTQRKALVVAQKNGLEKCRGGYRVAFTVTRSSFCSKSVRNLIDAGLLEKRAYGHVRITPMGERALGRDYAKRTYGGYGLPEGIKL